MAHATKLIIDLENEVERTEAQWRSDIRYHSELYRKYLNLQNILFTTNRRFRVVPGFHNTRNIEHLRRAHNTESNEASGSGTRKRGLNDPGVEQEGHSGAKVARDDQYTSDTIQLRPAGYRHVKLFGHTSRQFDMRLRNLDKVSNIETHMETCFNEAVSHFGSTDTIGQHDQVGLEIDYAGLRKNDPILVHFRQLHLLSGWAIMRAIARVLQSHQHINMSLPASITVTHLATPIGGGRNTKVGLQFTMDSDANRDHYSPRNGHLVGIMLGDQLCLPKCILIAQARNDNALHLSRTRHRNNKAGLVVNAAIELLRRAGITHNGPCSLSDVRQIQAVVTERILIFDRVRAHACIWDGSREYKSLDNRDRILLQLNNGHFDLIKSLPAFLGTAYYCFDCMKPFSDKHNCTAQCSYCLTRALKDCALDGTRTTCNVCNRWFKSAVCFANHKVKLGGKKPACALMSNCKDCGYRITVNKHECGKTFCRTCKKSVEKSVKHVCFIQKHTAKKEKKNAVGKEIFCDFESCFVTGGAKELHRPIFAVAQVQCTQCSANWSRNVLCETCNEPPEQTFMGLDTLEQFCRWLFADNHKHAVAVFHNMRNYDGQFITQWLSTTAGLEFKVIPRGVGLLTVTCNYLRIICSMSYLSVALRKLPSMFKFEDRVKKGEFPYRLLTDVVQLTNEPIPWPPIELFDPDNRSASDRDALLAWYETVKDKPFHTLDELNSYCKLDVTILRIAMSMFRDMFLATSGIHPYRDAFTIASACMQSFTKNHMPADTLMIHKESGPRKTSKKCMHWLMVMEVENKVRIRSSSSPGGEFSLVCGNRNFAADGVVQNDAGIVTRIYEFYGCYFHACNSCYKYCEDSLWMGEETTFRDKYNETLTRMDIIREFYPDAVVIEIWEHEYDTLAETPRVAHILSSLRFKEPIDPRKALKGGRVEVCQLRGQSDDPAYGAGYNDVVSMYPDVQMREAFPIGAYRVIHDATLDMMRGDNGEFQVPWFGIMQVKLLATKRLFHSPVPFNTPGPDAKLVFPLCATCAIEQSNTCAHTVDERAWWTTLCTVEVQLAFEHGFVALELGEVWQFDNKMQFDPAKKGSGLFSDYVASWLCKKVEASGYPATCETEVDKAQFIEEYKTKQNVILDPANMEFNAPMRATAKLALNNLWGKLCQRNNQTKYSYFKEHEISGFYNLTLDPNQTKSAVYPMSENCMCVIHNSNEETGEPSKSQSLVIGVFVTCYARRNLFRMMHKLGPQVIYTDTDSVIFVKDPDGYDPPLSSFLGGWESELAPDEYINSFVVTSPKSYSLRVTGPKGLRYITKAKGFTLNYMTSKLLNHDTMCELADEYIATGERSTITTWRHTIAKNRMREVFSDHLSRKFRVVNTKRTFTPLSSHCRPFGFDNPALS